MALTAVAQLTGTATFKVVPLLKAPRLLRAVRLSHKRMGRLSWLLALAAFQLGLLTRVVATKARGERSTHGALLPNHRGCDHGSPPYRGGGGCTAGCEWVGCLLCTPRKGPRVGIGEPFCLPSIPVC